MTDQATENQMIGKEIGPYRIERTLGEGGMGAVYLAHDRNLDRQVAIKFLLPEIARDGNARTRFIREARSAARINHPHTVVIHQVGQRDEMVYVVMELLTGGSLQDVIRKKGSLPWREAVDLIHQAAAGLGAAHAHEIVHRDIKPDNLMLTADGRVKVTDFGLAKAADMASMAVTRPGAMLGTPLFMAPEQFSGEEASARSDVYSLACTLQYLLMGRPPYTAPTVTALGYKHVHEAPPDPREFSSHPIPDQVLAALQRGLGKDAAARYPDARAFAADLAKLKALTDDRSTFEATWGLVGDSVMAPLTDSPVDARGSSDAPITLDSDAPTMASGQPSPYDLSQADDAPSMLPLHTDGQDARTMRSGAPQQAGSRVPTDERGFVEGYSAADLSMLSAAGGVPQQTLPTGSMMGATRSDDSVLEKYGLVTLIVVALVFMAAMAFWLFRPQSGPDEAMLQARGAALEARAAADTAKNKLTTIPAAMLPTGDVQQAHRYLTSAQQYFDTDQFDLAAEAWRSATRSFETALTAGQKAHADRQLADRVKRQQRSDALSAKGAAELEEKKLALIDADHLDKSQWQAAQAMAVKATGAFDGEDFVTAKQLWSDAAVRFKAEIAAAENRAAVAAEQAQRQAAEQESARLAAKRLVQRRIDEARRRLAAAQRVVQDMSGRTDIAPIAMERAQTLIANAEAALDEGDFAKSKTFMDELRTILDQLRSARLKNQAGADEPDTPDTNQSETTEDPDRVRPGDRPKRPDGPEGRRPPPDGDGERRHPPRHPPPGRRSPR